MTYRTELNGHTRRLERAVNEVFPEAAVSKIIARLRAECLLKILFQNVLFPENDEHLSICRFVVRRYSRESKLKGDINNAMHGDGQSHPGFRGGRPAGPGTSDENGQLQRRAGESRRAACGR